MDNNNHNTDKSREETDRHLQSPGEANRDKHINFTALERGEQDPADIDDSKVHLINDSTLQTREEKENDNRVDPRQDRENLDDEVDLSEGRGIVDRNIQ